MFSFVKKLFPIRVRTLDEFIQLVKGGAGRVVIAPRVIDTDNAMELPPSLITRFRHTLRIVYKSTLPDGRVVIHTEDSQENYFDPRGPDYTVGNALIRAFLIGEKKANELRQKLPKTEIVLMGPGGKTTIDLAKLRRDAELKQVVL